MHITLQCVGSMRIPPCLLAVGVGPTAAAHHSPQPSTPWGHFFVAMDKSGMPSSSLGAPPPDDNDLMQQPYDKELESGMEVDDEDDGGKPGLDGNKPGIDPKELEILQGIVTKGQVQKLPSASKLGDKWGLSQLDGSASSKLSGKDLDAKGMKSNKKGLMPTKAVSNSSQWTDDDIDVVCQ